MKHIQQLSKLNENETVSKYAVVSTTLSKNPSSHEWAKAAEDVEKKNRGYELVQFIENLSGWIALIRMKDTPPEKIKEETE